MKQMIELNRAAFPDMQLVVDDQIAKSDKVETRWHLENGARRPEPAIGRRPTITGITIDRFEEGKIVEVSRVMDIGLTLAIAAPMRACPKDWMVA
jgi:predicted ester cyclase